MQKSVDSGDMTMEQAEETKYDIIRDVAQDYEVPSAGVISEMLKNVDKDLKHQVDSGVIEFKDVDGLKKDILQELYREEIDKVISARINGYRLVKVATNKAVAIRMNSKVQKFIKIANNNVDKNKIEKMVEEVSEEENGNTSLDMGD